MKFITMLMVGLSLVCSAGVYAADKNSDDSVKPAMTQADKKAVAAAEAAIAAAEKSRKQAASVEGEWRDTGKFIKKAQEALKKGDTKKAIKLASFAERQGKYGYEQAMSQKDFKMPSYLKY